MGLENRLTSRKTASEGEKKIAEYVNRIREGEAAEKILQGLPTAFRAAIHKQLAQQAEDSETIIASEALKDIHMSARAMRTDETVESFRLEREESWKKEQKRKENQNRDSNNENTNYANISVDEIGSFLKSLPRISITPENHLTQIDPSLVKSQDAKSLNIGDSVYTVDPSGRGALGVIVSKGGTGSVTLRLSDGRTFSTLPAMTSIYLVSEINRARSRGRRT